MLCSSSALNFISLLFLIVHLGSNCCRLFRFVTLLVVGHVHNSHQIIPNVQNARQQTRLSHCFRHHCTFYSGKQIYLSVFTHVSTLKLTEQSVEIKKFRPVQSLINNFLHEGNILCFMIKQRINSNLRKQNDHRRKVITAQPLFQKEI